MRPDALIRAATDDLTFAIHPMHVGYADLNKVEAKHDSDYVDTGYIDLKGVDSQRDKESGHVDLKDAEEKHGDDPEREKDVTSQFYAGPISDFFNFVRAESLKAAGLELNLGKCYILPPRDSEPPDVSDLPDSVSVKEGVRVVGSPIGSPAFCVEFVEKAVDKVLLKASAMVDIHPQLALRALKLSTASSLMFLAQTTPFEFTRLAFERFDNEIFNIILSILSKHDRSPPIKDSPDRLARARRLVFTPTKYGGWGFTSIARIAPSAYVSSVITSAHLEQLRPDLLDGSKEHFRHAQEAMNRQLQGQNVTFQDDEGSHIIHNSTHPLSISDRVYAGIFSNNLRPKMQKAFTDRIQEISNLERLKTVSNVSSELDVSRSDTVAHHASGKMHTFLDQPIGPYNLLSQKDAVCLARSILHLNQETKPQNITSLDSGLQQERCAGRHANGHDRLIDPHGNHANSGCPACSAGNHTRHRLFSQVLRFAANKSGLACVVEPSTQNDILENAFDFSTVAFPKNPSKRLKTLTAELRAMILHVSSLICW